MLDYSPRHQNILQFQNFFDSLSVIKNINLRCVLCSLAEAVSPGCTLMSERTPRDGWRLPSPSETRRSQTASYFHSLSLSLLVLMQTSQQQKNNAPNLWNSIVPFSTQNLFPQPLRIRADELERMHAPALLSILLRPKPSRLQPALNS